jgi:hypothetical protein
LREEIETALADKIRRSGAGRKQEKDKQEDWKKRYWN